MAEALAADMLAARGVAAQVASCGVQESGEPAVRHAAAEMARRGLDLSGHRSRQIDASILGWADLILTMERSHLVALAEVDMSALPRAFALRELARLAPLVGDRPVDEPVGGWIGLADRLRSPSNVLALGTGDDVPDPLGGSRRAFRRSASEIHDLLAVVFDHLFASAVVAQVERHQH
jgi:protein-tyrosine phosphatase